MNDTDSEKFNSPDIEAYQAMKLLDSNDAQGAIIKCRESINQYGPNRNCFLVKARAHIEQEEYGFAQESLESVLRLDPEHPAAWAMMGEVYFRLGKEAKVDYCRNRLESIFPAIADYFEQEETGDEQVMDTEPEVIAETENTKKEITAEDDSRVVEKSESETESITANKPKVETPDRAAADAVNDTEISDDLEEKPAVISESIVPLEDFNRAAAKQNDDIIQSNNREVRSIESTDQSELKREQVNVLKAEIFETATFADICFNQGKYEKALKVYKKLLNGDPDNNKYKERIKIIESKIGK